MSFAKDFEVFYKEMVQFDDHLGMDLTVHAPGNITYTLKIEKHHLTSPDACHGGVIAAFMDAVIGVTVLSWAVSKENLCATVEFKINYLTRVKPGDVLEGTGDIDFTGSKLVVASGKIVEKKTGRLVAKGIGTFSQYPLAKKFESIKDLGTEEIGDSL
ncbi:MAG: PaaI family thioesterase [Deltaproteobacteria bacterium]|nr:PaaI family thioesterase [Deltaproteobacteria bacterium]MBW2218283.1 PaaI family thioesterase [Deltaproteobacteria bacterium]